MTNPRLARCAAALLVLASVAAACTKSGGAPGAPGELRVVTAFYPIELAARRVGGSFVAVSNLTPPGGEPHDLELKPSDVVAIRGADLVLYFDQGFQPALDDAIETMPDKSKVVDLLQGMPLRPPSGANQENLKADPHVWLSPVLMQKLVDGVTEALAKRLPARAAEFRAAAASLDRELAALDEEFRAKLSNCARKDIFTSHAAFAYLADRYGLRQVAISGLSPEAEPSPKRLQEVARLARAAHATTIFFETLVSPRVSQAVARIAHAKTAVLDPIEGLTPEEAAAGADYFSIMRSNLVHLVEALGCKT
jgi:zinc transport system substrate-binding protein